MQRYFFATSGDLLPIFERVESKHNLSYTLDDNSSSPQLSMFYAGATIPTLHAKSPYPNAVSGAQYLITHSQYIIPIRAIPQKRGGIHYVINHSAIPDRLIFRHGGIFGSDVLLHGYIANLSDTPFATQIYRAFASAITKNFSRIQSFWVGPQAEVFLNQGWRLTMSADSPPEYDLAR